MEGLARVLKGLQFPIQLVGQAREIDAGLDWDKPPRLERRWYAVVDPRYERTLRKALEGIGLRCEAFHRDGDGSDHDGTRGACDRDWLRLGVRGDHDHAARDRITRSGGAVSSSLVLRRWPREVAPGWLGQALALDIPVDVGIHVRPQDPQWIARKLRGQQVQQQGSDDAGDMLGARDAETVRQDLIARRDRPVSVAVAFTVYGPDAATLKDRVRQLRQEFSLSLAEVWEANYEQDRGYTATQPMGVCDLLGAFRTLDCTSVASTWPFQPTTVLHRSGADIGTTHDGSMLVRLDPFDPSLESFGGVVLAKVGSGKSYLLKLLARRLTGVEVLIVEQRNPPEYGAIEGATTLNLADIGSTADRAEKLRDFVSALWETAKRDPRPRLLVLDELWSLLRDPALAALVEEVARIGRHHFLSLFISTQQVQELLSSDQGLAVLNNAAIHVYLKQHGPDGELLAEKMRLSSEARQFLRGATRGQALINVNGMLVPVDIQASEEEHRQVTTDPRERATAA